MKVDLGPENAMFRKFTEIGLMLLVGKLPDDKSFSFKKCKTQSKIYGFWNIFIVRKCLLSVNKKLLEGIVFQQR